MAFTHWTASSVSPKKSVGRATLISVVLVVVDIGFASGGGGLAGGCGGGTAGGGTVVDGMVVDITGGAVVTRRVTGGKGLVIEMLGCELEGGSGAMCLDGKGRDAGLAVY